MTYAGEQIWETARPSACASARPSLSYPTELFTIHTARHTCASRPVQRGVDILVAKEWLGHKWIQPTQRYAHLRPEDLLAVVHVLECSAKDATSHTCKLSPAGIVVLLRDINERLKVVKQALAAR